MKTLFLFGVLSVGGLAFPLFAAADPEVSDAVGTGGGIAGFGACGIAYYLLRSMREDAEKMRKAHLEEREAWNKEHAAERDKWAGRLDRYNEQMIAMVEGLRADADRRAKDNLELNREIVAALEHVSRSMDDSKKGMDAIASGLKEVSNRVERLEQNQREGKK